MVIKKIREKEADSKEDAGAKWWGSEDQVSHLKNQQYYWGEQCKRAVYV